MGIFDLIFGRAGTVPPATTHVREEPQATRSKEDITVDRNVKGIALEKAGDVDAAIALYEANVADGFDGSHPYERLMIIYMRAGNPDYAKRVARACLVQATGGLSDHLRARCAKVLATATPRVTPQTGGGSSRAR